MSQFCQQMTREEVKAAFKSLKRKLEFHEQEQSKCQKRLKLMESLLTEEEKLEVDVKLENEEHATSPPGDQLRKDDELVSELLEEVEKDTAAEPESLSCQDDEQVTAVTQQSVTVVKDELMIDEEVKKEKTTAAEPESLSCQDEQVTAVTQRSVTVVKDELMIDEEVKKEKTTAAEPESLSCQDGEQVTAVTQRSMTVVKDELNMIDKEVKKEKITAAEPASLSCQDEQVTAVTQRSVTVVDDDLMIDETDSVDRAESMTSAPCLDLTVTYVRLGDAADFPHQRSECVHYKFTAPHIWQEDGRPFAENAQFCNSCFCYVCDTEVSKCDQWMFCVAAHCNSHYESDFWKKKKENRPSLVDFMKSLKMPEDLDTEKIRKFVNLFADCIKRISDGFVSYRQGTNVKHETECCACDCHHPFLWDASDGDCDYCTEPRKEHCLHKISNPCGKLFYALETKLSEDSCDGAGAACVVYLVTEMLLNENYTPESDDDFPDITGDYAVENFIKGLAETWLKVLLSGFVSADIVIKLQSLLKNMLHSFVQPEDLSINIKPLERILKLVNHANDLDLILAGTATQSDMVKYPEKLAFYVYEELIQYKMWRKCLNFAMTVEVKQAESQQACHSTDVVFLNRSKVRNMLPVVAIELGYIEHAIELLVFPYSTKLQSGKLNFEDFSKFKESLGKASSFESSQKSPLDQMNSTELTSVTDALLNKCRDSSQNKVDCSRYEYLLVLKLFVRSVHVNTFIRTQSHYLNMFSCLFPVKTKYDQITAAERMSIESAALNFVKAGAESISAMEREMPSFADHCEVKIAEICMWTIVWTSLNYPLTVSNYGHKHVQHYEFLSWLLARKLHLNMVSYYMKIWTLSAESKKQGAALDYLVIAELMEGLEVCGTGVLDGAIYDRWIKSRDVSFSQKHSLLKLFLSEIEEKNGAEKLLLQKQALRYALIFVNTEGEKLNRCEWMMTFLRHKYYTMSLEIDDKAFSTTFKKNEFDKYPSYRYLMELKKVTSPDVWPSTETLLCEKVKHKIGTPCQLESDSKHADVLELFIRLGDWQSVDKLMACFQSGHICHDEIVFGKVILAYEWIEFSDKLDKHHSIVRGYISRHLANYVLDRNRLRDFTEIFKRGEWDYAYHDKEEKTYTVPMLMENLIGNISTDKYLAVLNKAVSIVVTAYSNAAVWSNMKCHLIQWIIDMRKLYVMVDRMDSFLETMEWIRKSLKHKQGVQKELKIRHEDIVNIKEWMKKVVQKPMRTRLLSYSAPAIPGEAPVIPGETPVVPGETPFQRDDTPTKKNKRDAKSSNKKSTSSSGKKTSTSVVNTSTLLVNSSNPAVNTSTPVVNLSTPVVNTSTPVVNLSTPVVKTSTPVVNTSTPVVNLSTPVVNTSTPVVNTSTPVVNLSTPVVNTSTPVVNLSARSSETVIMNASRSGTTNKSQVSPSTNYAKATSSSLTSNLSSVPGPVTPVSVSISNVSCKTAISVCAASGTTSSEILRKPLTASACLTPTAVTATGINVSCKPAATVQKSSKLSRVMVSIIKASPVPVTTPLFPGISPSASTCTTRPVMMAPTISSNKTTPASVTSAGYSDVSGSAPLKVVDPNSGIKNVVDSGFYITTPDSQKKKTFISAKIGGKQYTASVNGIPAVKNQMHQTVSVAGYKRLPLTDLGVSNVLTNVSNSVKTPVKEMVKQSVSVRPAVTPASSTRVTQQPSSSTGTSSNEQRKVPSLPQFVPVLMKTGKISLIQLPTGVDFSNLPGTQTQPLQISQSSTEKLSGVIIRLPPDQRHHMLKYLPNSVTDEMITQAKD